MPYVLVRVSDGLFVAPPGSRRSYVRPLVEARMFTSCLSALAERLPESEAVVWVDQLGGLSMVLPAVVPADARHARMISEAAEGDPGEAGEAEVMREYGRGLEP